MTPLLGNVMAIGGTVSVFFELTTSARGVWARPAGRDISAGRPPQGIDSCDETLAGDVTSRFVPVDLGF